MAFYALIWNDKFQKRFDDVERQVTNKGERMRDLTLAQLEAHWQVAKTTTKDAKS